MEELGPECLVLTVALENLSTGQKATVILLILLLDCNGPLIVDQPEDDLDNQFITETVVNGPGRGRIAHAGSIDTTEVRRAVERLLEGGERAFRTRHRKYGF